MVTASHLLKEEAFKWKEEAFKWKEEGKNKPLPQILRGSVRKHSRIRMLGLSREWEA